MKFRAWINSTHKETHGVTVQIDGKTKALIHLLTKAEAEEIVRRMNDKEEAKK